MPRSKKPPKLRPEIEAALRAQDDRDLHQLTGFRAVETARRSGVRLRLVPAKSWRRAEDEEGYTVAVVSCVCNAKPQIYAAAAPAKCEGCERWFFFDTTAVWVLNTPARSD